MAKNTITKVTDTSKKMVAAPLSVYYVNLGREAAEQRFGKERDTESVSSEEPVEFDDAFLIEVGLGSRVIIKAYP